jgi:AsmA-like C-terminal region
MESGGKRSVDFGLNGSRRSRILWIGASLGAVAVVVGAAIVFAVYRAEPVLRARVIETLSARFHGPVVLAEFHVSIAQGLQVSGDGLKIYGPADPNPHEPGVQPLIAIREFRFKTTIGDLLHEPMRVQRVYLRGLELNIPPKGQREATRGWRNGRIDILVDEFVCDEARLIINTLRPDKLPLEFLINNLQMRDIGPGQPMHFDATLINPKPVGKIQSSGLFGPWRPEDGRSTPVKGTYSFRDADLSTIKGIGGMLASTGEYRGSLGDITVDGKTETPDFRLAISNHPVPLHTEFHAIVDGTSGDTYLEPVHAKLIDSTFIAKGSVVRVKSPQGHQIVMDVSSENARIEDFLRLAMRTEPPALTGSAAFRAKMELAPGSEDVNDRLRIAGTFRIASVRFTEETIQSRVDALSERSRGRPELVKTSPAQPIRSEMDGTFALRSGLLSVPKLHFSVPGTNVQMTGTYQLDGSEFDFHGKADLDAKVSQMVTGWKSLLLKPVDPFFSKHGAGTEVPIRVSGTKSEFHFGLDLGRKEGDADLKDRTRQK